MSGPGPNDPALGLHPLLAAALVALVGVVVLVWDPLRTDPATTTTVTSNVLDIGTLQQEKEALTTCAATVVPTSAAVPTNAEAAAALAGEKVAIRTRPTTWLRTSAESAADFAADKAAITTRGVTAVDLLTPEDEKRLLVTRGG